MIDPDNLKQRNDTYGHGKGDVAINALCKLVCSVFKRADKAMYERKSR